MTDCYSQRIRGITLRHTVKFQQSDHHLLDLFLAGIAVSGRRLFDLAGRILTDRQSGIESGKNGGSPRVTQFEGRINVLRDKRLLNGKLLGAGLQNYLADPVIDLFEFVHKDLALRPDAS